MLDSASEVRIVPCGDRQLWVVSGTAPVDGQPTPWSLPVYADPFGAVDTEPPTHWRLEAAIAISGPQYEALEATLRSHLVAAKNNEWVVRDESLPAVAAKAPGITPRAYLKWPNQKFDPRPEEDFVPGEGKLGPEAARFLQYVYERTGVAELPTLRIVWKAICQQALFWMAEERRPLDLGFATLCPLPYRINWKDVLLNLIPESPAVMRKRWAKKQAVLLELGFMANLRNSLLIALQRPAHFAYWKLEVIEGHDWVSYSASNEADKLAKIGPVRYARGWVKAVNKLEAYILAAYHRWTLDLAYPCAQLASGGLHGGNVLVPRVPKGRVQAITPPTGEFRVVVDSHITEPLDTSQPEPEDEAPGSLLGLPDLQPEAAHLWLPEHTGPGPDVGEPRDGQDRTDGVPLLHAPQGDDSVG